MHEDIWIMIDIALKFVPKGHINNIPALVQIMAWHWLGDQPLSETMMDLCITGILWGEYTSYIYASLGINELT